MYFFKSIPASLYGERKMYKESEKMFRKALKLNPEYAEAYFNLGMYVSLTFFQFSLLYSTGNFLLSINYNIAATVFAHNSDHTFKSRFNQMTIMVCQVEVLFCWKLLWEFEVRYLCSPFANLIFGKQTE